MFYMLLISKSIYGSSGSMHMCMFLSLVYASLRRSVIFGLALASEDLLGVGSIGGLSSHSYPGLYITVGICPIGFFYKV